MAFEQTGTLPIQTTDASSAPANQSSRHIQRPRLFTPEGEPETSALADVLWDVPQQVRVRVGISDATLVVLEVVVVMARRLLDDSDPREWPERLKDVEGLLPKQVDPLFVSSMTDNLESTFKTTLPKWVTWTTTPQGRTFLRRLVGAAVYDRVEKSLRADGALLLIGARRLLRMAIPTAVALDSATSFLSPTQIRSIGGFEVVERVALNLAFAADVAIDKVLSFDLPLADVPLRIGEEKAFEVDVETLAAQILPLVAGQSEEKVAELSDVLARKLRGAQQALRASEDGVSQAANSLIEFVDRLLRSAFSDQDTLQWIGENYPTTADLTYEQNGNRRPTKRGQALCFAHGGQSTNASSNFHLLAAAGLASVRTELQKIKHADAGTVEETETVEKAIGAVQGFFLFAIRAGWANLSGAKLEDFRAKFAA